MSGEAEFGRCGEWLTHRDTAGNSYRHTDNEECPVCRGEVESAPRVPSASAEEHSADYDAERKLAAIRKAVDDHVSVRSMDNRWPEDWAEEIEAILDGTACLDCGAYPHHMWRGGTRFEHYSTCPTRVTPPETSDR